MKKTLDLEQNQTTSRMASYRLLKDIVEKLELYEASSPDKNQLDLSGFANYLAQTDVKHFESDKIDAGDKSSAERDKRLEMEKTPGTMDNNISQSVVFLYRYAKQYTKKALKNSELKTIDEFTYLATLLNFNNLSKIELINKSVQEKTTGMETIKRLLKNNLIEQFDNPSDQRSQLLQLTPKGKGVLFGVFENMSLVSKVVTGNLTHTEKIQLAYLLKKLDTHHNAIFLDKKGAELHELVFSNSTE
jgi:MarR family transcriptional regulator, lower aerobic nicotinate degradation pathway regulator